MPDSTLPRRILMTGDTVGGVWTFTLELAEALGGRGIDVVLAAMGGEAAEAQRAEAARIPNLTLHSSSYKLEWMDDPWADVADSGCWLLDLESRYSPDLIHLNTLGHGALPWQSPVVLTAHSCVLSWWAAVKREPLDPAWDRYRREAARSIEVADVVTTPSRTMLEAVERHYGPNLAERRMVVPNGRNPHRFTARTKEPFVLTAGRLWDEGKNAAAVAQVAGRIDWPVYMAGESGALDGCNMLGRLASHEMAGWFGRASIYALPARYEPFGLSALEAGLAGCALVLGDIPSLREVWDNAAVFVPPDDGGALEAALRKLIAEPRHRGRMARRARDRARSFTPERMADGYVEAYAAAVAERGTACVS